MRTFFLRKWVYYSVVLILLVILGFLTKTAFTPSKNLPTKNISPSPINYTQNIFKYDTTKAEKLLTQYIKDTIKPEFLPAKIEVKQGLGTDGKIDKQTDKFGAFFETEESTIAVNFHFKESTAISNNFSIFIRPKNVNQTTATTSLANSFLSSYFLNPYEISNCQKKNDASYCENFKTTTEGKQGYGIAFVNDATINSPPKLILVVFTCFVPKDSKFFDEAESCIAL